MRVQFFQDETLKYEFFNNIPNEIERRCQTHTFYYQDDLTHVMPDC